MAGLSFTWEKTKAISYSRNWKVLSSNSADVLSQSLGTNLVTGSQWPLGQIRTETAINIWLVRLPPWQKKLYGPFLWVGFNCLKAEEPLLGGSLLVTTKFPGDSFWYSVDQPRKDERLSRSWSHSPKLILGQPNNW